MCNEVMNRRSFVWSTMSIPLAAAVTSGIGRRLEAQVAHGDAGGTCSTRFVSPSSTANDLVAATVELSELQRLARSAVEAATRAGAAYADVRVAERHQLRTGWRWMDPPVNQMSSNFTYGIRVLVDGAWAFVHGSVPETDRITASAADAVAMAKTYVPLVVRRAELVPAPVVTGEWATPFSEDPFAVPLRDHGAMMSSYSQLTARLPIRHVNYEASYEWLRETRVFASSEGSLVSQLRRWVQPFVGFSVNIPVLGYITFRFPNVAAAAGGYETIGDPTRYQDAFLSFMDDVVRYGTLPKRTMDVGRYPVVSDGSSTGLMFGLTMGGALELDRVLGDEADASGRSYLGPPLEMLGTRIASPKLTVTATHALPTPAAMQWDDDGVQPHDYALITGGTLVDYHTSRTNALTLHDWYVRRQQPIRSHACAVAPRAEDPPSVRGPHVRIAPVSGTANLDTLCREVKNGLLLVGLRSYSVDQQFTSGTINSESREGLSQGALLKVERGAIVARVVGNGLNTATKRLWNEQLVALGDASTVQSMDVEVQKGMPWRSALQTASAPAMLFKDVNVFAHPRNL
jgi:TldD protein